MFNLKDEIIQENDHPQNKIISFMGNHAMEIPRVTVVVPAMNEAKNLPLVLPRIPHWVHEIILVDGNSVDNTVEVAKQLCPEKLRVITQSGRGKGTALRDGFAAATGDIVVMIDADGSMRPEEIPMYVAALMSGADFVKGSRFMQGGGTDDMEFYRYLGNFGFTLSVRIGFGAKYSDLCYGYAAFWRRVLPKLNLQSTGFEIETEMNIRALKAKLNVAEVPSFEEPRVYGTSNLSTIRDGFRVLTQIVKEFFAQYQPEKKEVAGQIDLQVI
jgi:glycosyltransferase involved in cell wall biosynthesis